MVFTVSRVLKCKKIRHYSIKILTINDYLLKKIARTMDKSYFCSASEMPCLNLDIVRNQK